MPTPTVTREDFDIKQRHSSDSRTGARLCAVQVVYQTLVHTNADADVPSLNKVAEDFRLRELGARKADKKLFNTLISALEESGVQTYQDMIEPLLRVGWTFDRLDPVWRALLLCAATELHTQADTPTAPIISQYTLLAAAYDDGGEETGFINAVLDKLAKRLR